MDATSVKEHEGLLENRWLILFFSVLSMIAVANFQYGWTLFVPPLQKHLRVEQAAVQVTFTVFVLLETWLVPFQGGLVAQVGPEVVGAIGGLWPGPRGLGNRQGQAPTPPDPL